ncbi:hypothetical protein JKP88DRAFT_225305 [Tribonema minus]|uniref:Mitochondrial import inner membrane translocase subunit TIM22 n=1 Tax=Tribonema minus TaxID=303371 RepID=A0A835YQU0_9STRA|nr:hypothetical protein JKP88DRAFT_225305 [Tribonema minus]
MPHHAVNVPWRELRHNPRTERDRLSEAELSDESKPESDATFMDRFDMGMMNRKLIFGVACGGVTGIMFGLMDSHRVISKTGQFFTLAAKVKETTRMTAFTGTVFGGYFAAYQGIKYGIQAYRGEDTFFNVFMATAISIAPVVPFPALRARLPYMAFLVAIDTLNSHVL